MLEAFCNEHVAPLAAVSSPTEDISGRVAGTIKAWVDVRELGGNEVALCKITFNTYLGSTYVCPRHYSQYALEH